MTIKNLKNKINKRTSNFASVSHIWDIFMGEERPPPYSTHPHLLYLIPQLCWLNRKTFISVMMGLKRDIVNPFQKKKQGPEEFWHLSWITCKSNIQGWAKVGLQFWVHEAGFSCIIIIITCMSFSIPRIVNLLLHTPVQMNMSWEREIYS